MTYEQLAEHVQRINLLAAAAASDGVSNYKPGELHDVSGLFAPFLHLPDPASFDEPIGKINAAIGAIGTQSSSTDSYKPGASNTFAVPVMTNMNSVAMALHDWTGDAAEAFQDKFVIKFEAYNHNQLLFLFVLRAALLAEREVWRRARQDIDKLAEQTIAALEEMTPCPAFTRDAWPVTFTIIAALIVLPLAAAPAPGTGLVMGLTVASIAAASAGAYPLDDTPSEITGGGLLGGPASIVTSLGEAISRLTKAIATEREKITVTLREANQSLQQNRGIVELPSPRGIHGLRYPDGQSLVTMSPKELASPAGMGRRR